MRQRIPVVVRLVWTAAELAVTLGAVLALLVVHQLWWTNREARASAGERVSQLERGWQRPAPSPGPPTPSPDTSASDTSASPDPRPGAERPARRPARRPGQDLAYAVLRIPRLGLAAPVAQGIGKESVLNKGYVGHYPGTAEPGQAGNTGLAGHRNTHGEPFRRLNLLRAGDTVRIDTADARYTYAVDRTLPQTMPGDGTVLAKVPYSSVHPGYRYTEPGYYLTLTTCTPEYTSKYRLVVWARLAKMEPR
ncbi:class E sortase [Streptomyces sp. NPDC042319]|uniref:class E sortase n=1 Tax=Streptomyces sp. NPDC042319 TaxID=3154332 RepID=UPI0033D57FBB